MIVMFDRPNMRGQISI